MAFLVLNLWVGARFYFWVRQFENGVIDTNLRRSAGVEGWLPIAGLMNLKILDSRRPDSSRPSRRDVSPAHVFVDGVPVPQGFLQLALPDRDHFRISVARWPETLPA
jgi:hypothetical protein